MSERRTCASVTDVPCACGYLQHAADDPDSPIEFEPLAGEYHVAYGDPKSTLVIYHCPFCGGAAPESKRHLLFAVITREEEDRLAELLAPVRTVAEAISHLGVPDRDDWSGTRREVPADDGRPPSREHYRTLAYERLSPAGDVWVTERADGQVHWQLVGKYIGPPTSGGGT